MNNRQVNILKLLEVNNLTSVNELSVRLSVSSATIRQDLSFLESEGLIKRVHGGAVLEDAEDLSNRLGFNYDKKLRIARMAAGLVNDGETILIESGSTNALLARELAKKKNITIITTNVYIARQLRKSEKTGVILLGGIYQPASESLVGKITRASLDQINFDKAFSNQSFRDFYVTYLIGGIGMNLVVEGYDHHWGRNREGTIESLVQLGKEFEFDVVNIKQFIHNGNPVNSSIIRDELNHGMVEDAAELLGRPYSLRGKVVAGDGRGRLLGYPTANIELDSQKKLVPDNGIYFVKVDVGTEKYFGMASIGVRPTFHSTGKRTIEVRLMEGDPGEDWPERSAEIVTG